MFDLNDRVAAKRRVKAETAFHYAQLAGATTDTGLAYVREGFHWLRAARAAEAGDCAPRHFHKGH